MSDPSDLSDCASCGHTAWAHGDQTGSPPAGAPCHAATGPALDLGCWCPAGYVPEAREASFVPAPPPGSPYAPGMKGYVVWSTRVARSGPFAVPGPFLGPDHHPAPDGPQGPVGYHPLAAASVWPTKAAAERAVRWIVPRGTSIRRAGYLITAVAQAELNEGVETR
jgi:hypothetical protein